jgi:hypothetical protein
MFITISNLIKFLKNLTKMSLCLLMIYHLIMLFIILNRSLIFIIIHLIVYLIVLYLLEKLNNYLIIINTFIKCLMLLIF